jgi:hypothetical protein
MGALDSLKVPLPSGWAEHLRSDEIREFRPGGDDRNGALQVSKLSDANFAFVSDHPDLGKFAEDLGKGFGQDGQNWGRPAGTKQGTCRFGRYGLSGFVGGEFPSMLVLVTVSQRAALLWTWLGPDSGSSEVKRAVEAVLESTEGE